jgi:hypothetical protein
MEAVSIVVEVVKCCRYVTFPLCGRLNAPSTLHIRQPAEQRGDLLKVHFIKQDSVNGMWGVLNDPISSAFSHSTR